MKIFRRFAVSLAAVLCLFSSVALAADYTVTAANVVASDSPSTTRDAAHVPGSGVTVTAGQTVYLASDNTWKLASSSASGTAGVAGITLNGAGPGQPVVVVRQDDSFTPGFTIAAGDIVILSATAGKLAPAADAATGNYVSVVMIGIGGNKAKLHIVRSSAAKP